MIIGEDVSTPRSVDNLREPGKYRFYFSTGVEIEFLIAGDNETVLDDR